MEMVGWEDESINSLSPHNTVQITHLANYTPIEAKNCIFINWFCGHTDIQHLLLVDERYAATSKCEHTNPTYFRFEFSHWGCLFKRLRDKKTIKFTGESVGWETMQIWGGQMICKITLSELKNESILAFKYWEKDLPQLYKYMIQWKFHPGVFGFFWGVKRFIILSVRVKDHSKDWTILFKNGWN